ncbi:methyltransferase domain-containing protein [bacterium]|nr:methyltransferase domain-containing protein [bacterium]
MNQAAEIRDKVRANLLKYTRRAFDALPAIVNPRILEIGCGTGLVTLELAKMSGGQIVAIDVDQRALHQLCERFSIKGRRDRIQVVQTSMQNLPFPGNSFDVIWSEGAIASIPFEDGLHEWGKLLVPGGCLVIHDVLTDFARKQDLIEASNYTILERFTLGPEVWWEEYYEPLRKLIASVGTSGPGEDTKSIEEFRLMEQELEQFSYSDDRFGSVFFVLRLQNETA